MGHEEIYSRDENGKFTVKAEATGHGWRTADLGGLILTTAGHAIRRQSFGSNGNDLKKKRWAFNPAFRRSPEPVLR